MIKFQFRIEATDWVYFEIIEAESEEQAWEKLDLIMEPFANSDYVNVADVYRIE